jgi:hypothetical protein
MTFATSYYDWQTNGPPDDLGAGCSPNLRCVQNILTTRWPFFTDLGCSGARPIRGSATVPSTHTYGAALDLGYDASDDPVVGSDVAAFLVGWSLELGVQMIGDYRRCRIWRAGRTPHLEDACTGWWKAQRPSGTTGMGQVWANHLHIETTPAMWSTFENEEQRGIF